MSSGDYEIGYGKPPKQHQFKKGQSGNPRGRPKKNESLAGLVVELLDDRVQVQTKEGARSMTLREAIARKLLQQAATGDPRLIKMMLDLLATAAKTDADDRPRGSVIVVPASIDVETGLLRVEDVEDDEDR